MKYRNVPEIILIISGLFLILDSIFLHSISFAYTKLNIGFIDPFFSHAILGFILFIIGAYYYQKR